MRPAQKFARLGRRAASSLLQDHAAGSLTDIEALEAEIAGLHTEVGRLSRLCEGLEFREAEKERGYEEENAEIMALQAEQKQLQDLLVALRPSKPEKGK